MFDLYHDFSEMVNDCNVKSENDRKIGIAQEQKNVREIAKNNCNSTDNMLEIGCNTYVMPVDYNGKIHFVKVSFEYFPRDLNEIEKTWERYNYTKK